MAYETRSNPGPRLGIYAPKVEELRQQKGLNGKGFPVNREDDAEAEDEEQAEGNSG